MTSANQPCWFVLLCTASKSSMGHMGFVLVIKRLRSWEQLNMENEHYGVLVCCGKVFGERLEQVSTLSRRQVQWSCILVVQALDL